MKLAKFITRRRVGIAVACVALVWLGVKLQWYRLENWWMQRTHSEFLFEPDITYGKVDGVELKLNLVRPRETKEALPCVLIFHGGAWRSGDRSWHNSLAWQFALRGYVAATVGYRFCPAYRFPAQIQDAMCAVRYLRANAEKYGIDSQRIGAMGYSAGGQLALLLGTVDAESGLEETGGSAGQLSKVQAVVAFFAPSEFNGQRSSSTDEILLDYFGGTRAQKEALYDLASPIRHLNRGDASILLFHGTNDSLVPYTQAVRMEEAMRNAGVPGRLETMAGGDHGWEGGEMARTEGEMFEFFDQNLAKSNPPR